MLNFIDSKYIRQVIAFVYIAVFTFWVDVITITSLTITVFIVSDSDICPITQISRL